MTAAAATADVVHRMEAHVVHEHNEDSEYVDKRHQTDDLKRYFGGDLTRRRRRRVENDVVEAGVVVAVQIPDESVGDVLEEGDHVVADHAVLVFVVGFYVHVREVVAEAATQADKKV